VFDIGAYRTGPRRALARAWQALWPLGHYPQDSMLRSVMPWTFPLDDDGTILTKWGGVQQSIGFRGLDDQSSSRQVQADFDSRVNNVLKRLGGGTALWIDASRVKSKPYVAVPREEWPGDDASWMIEAERVGNYNRNRSHLETSCHITYARALPTDRQQRFQHFWMRNAPKGLISNYREFVSQFRREMDSLALALQHTGMPQVDLLTTGETLTYLHSCISNRHHPVSSPDWGVPIDDMLADCDLIPGMAPMLGDHHLRVVSVLKYPSHTYPTILNELDTLGIEYRACWRWVPFDSSETDDFLDATADRWKRARKGLRAILHEAWNKTPATDLDGTAIERGSEVDAAASAVRNDLISLGRLNLTVTVMDKNESIADEMAVTVREAINGRTMTATVETHNTVEAWLGSIPGHPFANVRRRVVTSMNLSHLIRTTTKWSGPVRNDALGGQPLITCSTGGSDPFRYNPWVGDSGMLNVFGPNGAGKSAFEMLSANQFFRYHDAHVRVFEQGKSARIPTLCAGGTYYSLDTSSLAFQPLRYVDQYPERVWARDWLCDRIEQAGVKINPTIQKRVWETLQGVAAITDPNLRTLTAFLQLYRTDEFDDPVKLALEDFTVGAYGHLLNGDRDHLDLNSRWVTFEMGELLKAPKAAGAVLSYIFHRLEGMFDGRPTLIILDEGWQFLMVGQFARKIREWLKTLRKRRVAIHFASQEIADSVKSDQASTLISECLTKVFLANDQAGGSLIRDGYQQLGLREDEIDMIATMTRKRDYYVRSSLGSRVFDLDLYNTPVSRSVCGSSSDEDHATADRVLAQYGRERFFEGWLEVHGFHEEVEILRKINGKTVIGLAAE
jgi:type IV secretion/conjugal transfer VirB4 family ATPase